jgi:hypothetical protein
MAESTIDMRPPWSAFASIGSMAGRRRHFTAQMDVSPRTSPPIAGHARDQGDRRTALDSRSTFAMPNSTWCMSWAAQLTPDTNTAVAAPIRIATATSQNSLPRTRLRRDGSTRPAAPVAVAAAGVSFSSRMDMPGQEHDR